MSDTQSADGATLAWLTLCRTPGLHGHSLTSLLDDFGSVAALVGAPAAALRRAGLGDQTIAAMSNPDSRALEDDQTWLDAPRRHFIPFGSADYPALLAAIDDPPVGLFAAGDINALSLPQLAVVGSRNPTAGGRETAQAFAAHLARCGFGIVSGLATGIDAAAHRGALAAGGMTIAVCGTGLDQVYPPQNRRLAGEIATGGALVSEFPLGTPPRSWHFPRRNRIISGMAVGTLVIEAARRSGSLITARLAAEQGREVFAVPGSIHNPLARGCHRLIRDGAKLVESGDDILDELVAIVGAHVAATPQPETLETPHYDDDQDYRRLLDALGFDPIDRDTLIERTGLTADAVSSMLLILELQGRVLAAPGGRYTRASAGDNNQ